MVVRKRGKEKYGIILNNNIALPIKKIFNEINFNRKQRKNTCFILTEGEVTQQKWKM